MRPKQLVQEGYDRVSYAYRSDDGDGGHDYVSWVDDLCSRLTADARVLDLGCGCGVPAAQLIASRAQVKGVDLSPVQVQRARRLVPTGEFICDDMCSVRFPPGHFDAVVSFYAIIHVPVAEQRELFSRIYEWLKPGGLFMATLGAAAWTGTADNWLVDGATMYWSHVDAVTYRLWLEEIGFELLRDEFVPEEGSRGHQLFLGQTA